MLIPPDLIKSDLYCKKKKKKGSGSQPQWLVCVLAMPEAEIGKIAVQGQLGQKSLQEVFSAEKKLGAPVIPAKKEV
jgi:hypothetical protein